MGFQQWRGRELLDALRTGQGAHAEPLLLAISTRSPDPDNPLEELIRYGEQIGDGTLADPTFTSAIYDSLGKAMERGSTLRDWLPEARNA